MATYKIKNSGTGKYLNIDSCNGTSISNSQNVTQWDYIGANWQNWIIDSIDTSSTSTGVPIKSFLNQSCGLHIVRATKNCDVYLTASSTGGDGQAYFIKENTVSNGYYIVTKSTFSSTKHFLTIEVGNTNNGTNICWTPATGSYNQVWILEQISTSSSVYASVCSAVSDLTSTQTNANAKYVFDYLVGSGFTKQAACGVLGNMNCESGINPGIWEVLNNTTKGFGLVQWTAATVFLNWAVSNGLLSNANATTVNLLTNSSPKKLMDAELACLYYCCALAYYFGDPKAYGYVNHSGYTMTFSQYKASTLDAYTLAIVFHDHYERSGDTQKQIEDNRATPASSWYTKLA